MIVVDNLCVLCLNGLEDGVLLPICDHKICRVCLHLWERTKSDLCPRCKAKIRKCGDHNFFVQNENPLHHSQSSARVLPELPLPPPHQDMLLLYRGVTDEETLPNDMPDFCVLNCYVECNYHNRRMAYCGNCQTAFHRMNYTLNGLRGAKKVQFDAPTSSKAQIEKNPLSRAAILAEDERRNAVCREIHMQLVGHAVSCAAPIGQCGYPTCALMQKHLFPSHAIHDSQFSAHTRTSASSSNSGGSFGVTTTIVAAEQALAERQAQIDRNVGLGVGCRWCVRAANLLYQHEQLCSAASCCVPYCAELRAQRRLQRQQQLQQRQQQQQQHNATF